MEVSKKHGFFDTLIYGSILLLSAFVVIVSHPGGTLAQNRGQACMDNRCVFTTNLLHRATTLEINNQGEYEIYITRAESLNQALSEAGLDLGSGQVSDPHRYTSLTGGEVKVTIIESNIPVKIIDQNRTYAVNTSYSTVKNILYACNIKLGSKDKVYPDLESNVSAGSNIVIDRATPVQIAFGHETYLLETQADNVADVMNEAKQELGLPDDLTNHNLDHQIYNGQKINLVKINEQEIVEYEIIKSVNQYQDDWEMMVGEEKILEYGENGEKSKKYRLTLENGIEIKRELISEEITKESRPTKIATGKKQPEYTPPAYNAPAAGGQTGTASWYYYGGTPTAAHRDYPKGTNLLVTNNSTGASIVVVVNDYGPALWTGRIIDLNSVAFSAIAPLGQGLCEVTVTPI